MPTFPIAYHMMTRDKSVDDLLPGNSVILPGDFGRQVTLVVYAGIGNLAYLPHL